MIVGIIYKYTSPSGKIYIGQTTNEAHRRATWFCEKYRYAGAAINRARAKYGPENFTYEVLHKKHYFTPEEATFDLDMWESYYIGYYDSYKNGYNNTFGGSATRGAKMSEQTKEKLRAINTGRKFSKEHNQRLSNALKGKKHSEAARMSSRQKRRTSGLTRAVGQYDENRHLVRVWANAMEAAENLHIIDRNIYRACNSLGLYKGYYWRNCEGQQVCPPKPKKKITGNYPTKKVVQKDLQGNTINVYESVTQAYKSVGALNNISLSRCLHGKQHTAYGFKWELLNCA